jgi:phage shock protein A
MGLFKTIGNMFRGKANELDEKLQDPERDGKIAIEDSEKQVDEFSRKIQKLKASDNMLVKQIDEQKAEVKKYKKIAEKAAKAEDREALTKAIQLKNTAAEKLKTMEIRHAENDKLEAGLMKQLEAAKAKIAEAKDDLSSLAARKESAEIRKDMAEASSTFAGQESGLGQIDNFKKKVAEQEAEAEAAEEMAGANTLADDLLAQYDNDGPDVDDEVEKMLAKAKGK